MGVAGKRTVELQIDGDLLRRAQDAGVDLSTALERAVLHRLPPPGPEEKARFEEENRDAIEALNRYVEKNGLPLERYRRYPWPNTTSS